MLISLIERILHDLISNFLPNSLSNFLSNFQSNALSNFLPNFLLNFLPNFLHASNYERITQVKQCFLHDLKTVLLSLWLVIFALSRRSTLENSKNSEYLLLFTSFFLRNSTFQNNNNRISIMLTSSIECTLHDLILNFLSNSLELLSFLLIFRSSFLLSFLLIFWSSFLLIFWLSFLVIFLLSFLLSFWSSFQSSFLSNTLSNFLHASNYSSIKRITWVKQCFLHNVMILAFV